MPTFKHYAQKWIDNREQHNTSEVPTVVMSSLFFRYSKIKTTAAFNNEIVINQQEQTYDDQFINGVWQNPYETKTVVSISPPTHVIRSGVIDVIFPSELFLTNDNFSSAIILADFSDGQGYRQIYLDTPIRVNYTDSGVYDWKFEINRTHRDIFEIVTKMEVQIMDNSEIEVRTISPEYRNNRMVNGARLQIDYAPGHNDELRQPLIIAEGLDLGSITEPESFFGENNLRNFRNSVFQSSINLADLIDPENPNQEYYIVYVNWVNGSGRLQDNSEILEDVIAWVNANKVGNEPNVLLGQSMGGLIGRYTLARMEQDNMDHDVRLFITHDSPHQGSNTPASIQHFSRHIHNTYIESPVFYLSGEVVIPTIIGFADVFANIFGGDIDAYVSPGDYLTLQDTPAAIQLNLEWVKPIDENVTDAIHLGWQDAYDAMGYPQQSRNVAISNGNECSIRYNFNPGDKFLEINNADDPTFLGALARQISTPLLGVLTLDPELTFLGILPGGNEWDIDFDLKANPSRYNYDNRHIYYGRIRYTKKLLFLFDVTHTITQRSKDARQNTLPYDIYSGGENPAGIQDIVDRVPSLSSSTNVFINNYDFIPVTSALDIRNNGFIARQEDFDKRYGGGTVDYPNLSTEFNNFIVDYDAANLQNFEHISFDERNGDWLADELDVTPRNSDCRLLCDGQTPIQGEDYLCNTGNYFIDVTGLANPNINWAVSDPNFVALTVNNANDVTLSVTGNGNATIQLIATLNIAECNAVNVQIVKEIRVGSPEMPSYLSGPSDVLKGALTSYSAGPSEGAEEYVWYFPYPYDQVNTYDLYGDNWQHLTPWDIDVSQVFTGYGENEGLVQVMGRNPCGTSGARTIAVTFSNDGDGGQERNNATENIFQIYPNPATDYIQIDLNDIAKNGEKTQKIEISSRNGRLLKSISTIRENISEIDVSNFPSDIYFVRVTTDFSVYTNKFIIK